MGKGKHNHTKAGKGAGRVLVASTANAAAAARRINPAIPQQTHQSSEIANPQAGAADAAAGFWPALIDGGKIAAPLGALLGFVGDFLKPLAPFNGYLLVLVTITAAGLGLWLFKQPAAV